MKRLETCCYCGSLKTGTIITGALGIILSILTIIAMFLTHIEFKTIVFDWLPDWVVTVILVINLVMTVLISLLLIIGAIKRNSYMMLPWVVLGIILALGLLVSVIHTAVVLYLQPDALAGTLWLVFGIIFVLVYLYLWAVVFSYLQVVREDEERGRYQKAPYRR